MGNRVLLLGGASIPESDDHFADSEWWSADGIVAGPRMAAGRYKFLDSLVMLADGRVLVPGGGARAEMPSAEGSRFTRVDGRIGQRLAFATATERPDTPNLVASGAGPDIRVRHHAGRFSPPPHPQHPH